MDVSEQVLLRADDAAAMAGLRYVSDEETPGIARRRCGRGFAYYGPDGNRIRDQDTLERIRKLAIPPAWTSVWIAPRAGVHLAATGRDAKGRKQYRYDPEFVRIRGTAKFEHLIAFARSLPVIRKTIRAHLALAGMPREKVLATVVALLEATLIRVGNEDYVRQNGSFGLTTLRNRHVRVEGSELRFVFQGKSGRSWRLSVQDRRVAKVIRACQELPGQHLFQYVDADGATQKVTSSDVNDYLRAMTGREITAKDFRTWAGTVEAASAFHMLSQREGPATKKQVRAVLEHVAAKLGNTPAVCRCCYIHPELIAAFEQGEPALAAGRRRRRDRGLDALEEAVLDFLLSRRRAYGPKGRKRELHARLEASLAAAAQ